MSKFLSANTLGFTCVLMISGFLMNLENHLFCAIFREGPFNPTYVLLKKPSKSPYQEDLLDGL